MSQKDKDWYYKNRYRKLASVRCWWLKNRDEILARKRARYNAKKNDPKFKELNLKRALNYQKKNPEMVKTRNRRYREKHKFLFAVWEGERRFIKNKAMPPWVDRAAIREIYEEAAKRTRETGVAHHVDHRYPLRGKGFVGLHVPWNLQVLTATENISKGNRVQA